MSVSDSNPGKRLRRRVARMVFRCAVLLYAFADLIAGEDIAEVRG